MARSPPKQRNPGTAKRQNKPSSLDRIDLQLVENYIRSANAGNPRSALALLMLYTGQVRRGEQVEDSLLEFIANACEEILSGVPPANALRLTRKRQRPTKNLLRDIHIAVKVRRKMDSGQRLLAAASDVAEEYRLHESQIQEIYRRHKKTAIEQIRIGIVVP